jgi:thiol-disulfide isomerase/thioredoxin
MIHDVDDPIWGEALEKNLGMETIRRLRELKPEPLKREAEALYERTLKEFADLRPMGTDFPPLGEQAEGALFRIHNLAIGRTVPEIQAEDLDGKPMKLSESRGKVVLITFWATWCGPCMGMVPDEKALVERMKGRPFALVGVNGDDDRDQAKKDADREGITWRSFWSRGPYGPIALKWGVKQWPTIYLIDAKGIIRMEGLRGPELDKAVEALVADAEASIRSK